MIVTPRRFCAEVFRRGLRAFHHVKCDLVQNSSTAVRHHVSVNHFLSVVLQRHVVRCHSFNVCRTHHGKLRCKPGRARHVQNIQNRSSTRAPQFSTSQSDWDETDLPNSPCTDVSSCLPARISRVPHLRIQSRSLEINLAAVQTCLVSKFLRLVYCCHFH